MVIALHCAVGCLTNVSLFAAKTWWLAAFINGVSRMGVPLFFMISGFLALSNEATLNIRAFYTKRFSRLVIPFFFWDIVYFVLNSAAAGTGLSVSLFFTELFGHGSKYHLWFVYQIAGIYLLTPFLKMIIDRCSKRALLLFLFVILLQPTFLGFINSVQPYFKITPFLALIEGYAGYFVYGYILASFDFSRRQRGIIYGLGVFGLLISFFGNYFLSSAESLNLTFNAGYGINHYLSAGALFLAARELFERRGRLSSGRFAAAAGKISRLSFGIYLSHVLMIGAAGYISALAGFELSPAVNMVLTFVFSSLAATALTWCFSKLPLLRRTVI